jgi:DNA mismatch repair ATPase MutS
MILSKESKNKTVTKNVTKKDDFVTKKVTKNCGNCYNLCLSLRSDKKNYGVCCLSCQANEVKLTEVCEYWSEEDEDK